MRAVRIIDGRISAITSAGVERSPDVFYVAGRGLYLMPAFVDAHVHLRDPAIEGRLLIANGVTLVRDMGSELEGTINFRREVNEGVAVGPSIVISGVVDGAGQRSRFARAVQSAADAANVIGDFVALRIDQIKIYDASLTSAAYDHVARAANGAGVPFVGHAPAGIKGAIAAGQRSVEHLKGLAHYVVVESGHASPNDAQGPDRFTQIDGPWHLYLSVDSATRRQQLGHIAAAGMYQVPTLSVFDEIELALVSSGEPDSLLRYVRDGRLLDPEGMRARVFSTLPQHRAAQNAAIRDLHAAGVPIAAGTDYGTTSTVAGFSLHRELELLWAAGLPTEAVLRSTTTDAATLLGRPERGRVAVGQEASIVLLAGNPLDDIRATRMIRGVYHSGRFWDETALAGLLVEAAHMAAAGGTN